MFYQKLTHQYGSDPSLPGGNNYDSDEKSDDVKNVIGSLKSDILDKSSKSDLLEFIPLSPELIKTMRALDYKNVSGISYKDSQPFQEQFPLLTRFWFNSIRTMRWLVSKRC